MTAGAGFASYTALLEVVVVSQEVNGDVVTLRVEGALTGAAVDSLEQFWRRARVQKQCQVDLRAAHEIDAQGRSLISEMFANGVELVIGSNRPVRLQ
jgi:ABC-type transporter Mla MlaB component